MYLHTHLCCNVPALRSFNFQDVRSNNPTFNCTIGNYYFRYDIYTGSSDYSQVRKPAVLEAAACHHSELHQ